MSSHENTVALARADLLVLEQELRALEENPPFAGRTRWNQQKADKLYAINAKQQLLQRLTHYPLFPESDE